MIGTYLQTSGVHFDLNACLNQQYRLSQHLRSGLFNMPPFKDEHILVSLLYNAGCSAFIFKAHYERPSC